MGRHSGFRMSEQAKRKISEAMKLHHDKWPVIAKGIYPFRVEVGKEAYLFLVEAEHDQQAELLLHTVLTYLKSRGFALPSAGILRVTTFSRSPNEPTMVFSSGKVYPSKHLMKAEGTE